MRRSSIWLRGSRVGTRRRATQFLEFALLLPAFILFLLFTVDMGRIVMIQAGLQDATQQVAAYGAQNGGLGSECVNGGDCTSGTVSSNFQSAMALVPWTTPDRLGPIHVVRGGGSDAASGACSSSAPYVTVTTSYTPTFITPGVLGFFNLVTPNWTLRASASALCEISR